MTRSIKDQIRAAKSFKEVNVILGSVWAEIEFASPKTVRQRHRIANKRRKQAS